MHEPDPLCCTRHPAQVVLGAHSYTSCFPSVRVLEKGMSHDPQHLTSYNSSISRRRAEEGHQSLHCGAGQDRRLGESYRQAGKSCAMSVSVFVSVFVPCVTCRVVRSCAPLRCRGCVQNPAVLLLLLLLLLMLLLRFVASVVSCRCPVHFVFIFFIRFIFCIFSIC